MRTPAQTSRRHRIPRARGSLYGIWRAAGLLRRLRCEPMRTADALPATEPNSAPLGRASGLTPDHPGISMQRDPAIGLERCDRQVGIFDDCGSSRMTVSAR